MCVASIVMTQHHWAGGILNWSQQPEWRFAIDNINGHVSVIEVSPQVEGHGLTWWAIGFTCPKTSYTWIHIPLSNQICRETAQMPSSEVTLWPHPVVRLMMMKIWKTEPTVKSLIFSFFNYLISFVLLMARCSNFKNYLSAHFGL